MGATEPLQEMEPAGLGGRRSGAVRSLGVRLGLVATPAGDSLYHGFISYSHAADGELAPALQKGLQQFAKPWYRTRALHIFRDDAALSVNPHLWNSVRDALDASEYLILLASPQAAHSEWVEREVGYWCAHRQPEHILIGLTEGELVFGTAASGGTPADNAMPDALHAALPEEPRYLDLRWAHHAEDLALSHPRFRAAVAELAAPLHGRPKEELASEEVRQHRRTVRLARGAVGTILTLLVLAVIAAVLALAERSTAVTQARIASARELAAVSQSQLATNLDIALPLAARAYRTDPDPQTRAALLQADLYSPRLARFLRLPAQIAVLAPDAAGTAVLIGLANGEVERWGLGAAAPARLMRLPAPVQSLATDASASEVVATDGHRTLLWRAGRVSALRVPSGQVPRAAAVSPSGATVALYAAAPGRVFTGAQSVSLFTAAGDAVHTLFGGSDSWTPSALALPSDGTLVMLDGAYGHWERRGSAGMGGPGVRGRAVRCAGRPFRALCGWQLVLDYERRQHDPGMADRGADGLRPPSGHRPRAHQLAQRAGTQSQRRRGGDCRQWDDLPRERRATDAAPGARDRAHRPGERERERSRVQRRRNGAPLRLC